MLGRSRTERKVAAALRAKRALKQNWERIDDQFDVIGPTLMDIRAIEKTSEIELSEADLISLLTTGTLPIEASTDAS